MPLAAAPKLNQDAIYFPSIAVGVCGLPLHCGIKAAIILLPEQNMQERKGSIPLPLV